MGALVSIDGTWRWTVPLYIDTPGQLRKMGVSPPLGLWGGENQVTELSCGAENGTSVGRVHLYSELGRIFGWAPACHYVRSPPAWARVGGPLM